MTRMLTLLFQVGGSTAAQTNLAVNQVPSSAATTLTPCQAVMPLIMQISRLLEKLLCPVAAFLFRNDIIILFNWKEETCNIFLPSSILRVCFPLLPFLKKSRRGSSAWLPKGQQGKAMSEADTKGALAKIRKGTPLPSPHSLCRIKICKIRRSAPIPVHLQTHRARAAEDKVRSQAGRADTGQYNSSALKSMPLLST